MSTIHLPIRRSIDATVSAGRTTQSPGWVVEYFDESGDGEVQAYFCRAASADDATARCIVEIPTCVIVEVRFVVA